MALVSVEEDVEIGRGPPSWSCMVDEAQYTLVCRVWYIRTSFKPNH